MGQGGADRVTLSLLRVLPEFYEVTLVLLQRTGVWIDDIPSACPVASLSAKSLWTATKPLASYLSVARPDILLSLDSGGNIPAILSHVLTRRSGRLVISERNILFNGGYGPKRLLQVALKFLLYRFADSIAAVSAGVANDMIRILGLPPARVAVVYNPVVDETIERLAMEPVDHPWFNEKIPLVLSVGRLVPQKDHVSLLRAFAVVRSELPARLFVLGTGPLRQRLEAEAVHLRIDDAVHFAGFDKNPFRYMARCAVFALSSKNEGLPGALIQAMACAAPVVSTDCHAGPREVIDNPPENGILVPVGDHAAMASALLSILRDPARGQRMAAAGRRSALRFDSAAAIERYRQVLDPCVT